MYAIIDNLFVYLFSMSDLHINFCFHGFTICPLQLLSCLSLNTKYTFVVMWLLSYVEQSLNSYGQCLASPDHHFNISINNIIVNQIYGSKKIILVTTGIHKLHNYVLLCQLKRCMKKSLSRLLICYHILAFVVRGLNSFTLTGIDGVLLTHYHSNIKLVSFLQQLVFVLFNKFFNLKDRN